MAPCFGESRGRHFEMVTSAGQKLPQRNGSHLKTESRWGSKTFSRVLFGGTKLFQRKSPGVVDAEAAWSGAPLSSGL